MLEVNDQQEIQPRSGHHRFQFQNVPRERLLPFAPRPQTTLLRILSGFGADPGSYLPTGAEPHIVFQEPRLFPYLTVDEKYPSAAKSPHFASKTNALENLPGGTTSCRIDGYQDDYPFSR